MKKPIMIKGHPGDLLLILKESYEEVEDMTHAETTALFGSPDGDLLYGIAVATKEAMEMWLGEREIPLGEDGE